MKIDFEESEKLYRGVKKTPKFIKRDNTITRTAFTYTGSGSNGCSVFRQMGRENYLAVKECLLSLNGHVDFSVSIPFGLCIKSNIYIEHTPSSTSKYHSELFQNKEKKVLNDCQLDFLAINCKIEESND